MPLQLKVLSQLLSVPAGATSTTLARKLAVTLLFPLIVTEIGLLLPLAPPLQPLKTCPAFLVKFTVTTVPGR